MKTPKRKQKINKKRLVTLTIIALISAVVGSILLYNQLFQSNNKKNDTIPSLSPSKDKTVEGKTEDSETTPNTPVGKINITVSTIGQDDKGGPLLVRTILDGADGGTCSIQASKATIVKTYSTSVEFSGTYYSCNYNIPYSDLSPGQWTVVVKADQSGKSGEASGTTEVRS